MEKVFLNIAYYFFYLLFPVVFIIIAKIYSKKPKGEPIIELVVLLVVCLILLWARFAEPNMIKTKRYETGSGDNVIKLAIFSDPHIGIYKNEKLLERVVKKINESNIDAVIIPGDFIYYSDSKKISEQFSSLKDIEKVKIAVLGNHDYDKEGYVKANEVSSALRSNSVLMIDNKVRLIEINDKKVEFVGVEDLWTGQPDYSILKKSEDDNVDLRIFVTHNPDTIYELNEEVENIKKIDFMISGHTHAGQIRIPFLYKHVIPSNCNFDKGFYNIDNINLFITAGIGNVVLPMRLFNRPELSIIDLKF
jgi:uncharacterized protein